MKHVFLKYRLGVISICLSLVLLCSCTTDHTKQVAIPNTEIKQITADANKVPYKIFIILPEGYHSKGHHSYRESYPVLYLLDPDVEFGLAENIARTMVNYDNIEPFIIVGIGYQDQDLSTMDSKTFWDKWTQNRARDYIPIQVSAGKEDFEGGDHKYKGLSAHTGGSEKFKDFIEQELIPLGPSLWVEKGQMMKQANKLQSSAKITAYFAVGSKEHDANRSMVDEVKLFYSDLPKSKNFKSKLEIIDDENHVSMVPASLTKGFKFLFGK